MDLFTLVILLIFLAVVFLLEGAYLTWNTYKGPEANRIERRLRAMSAGVHGGAESSILKERLLSETPFLEHILMSVPRVHQLDRLLQQSGSSMKVAAFIGISVLLALVAFVAPQFFALPLPFCIIFAVVALFIPYLYVSRARNKRLEKFEEQLPDGLDLIGRAMRAGHALPNALNMVGDEMAEPLGGEFAIVFDEVNYGFSMQDALMNLATRVPSTDLRYFVVAVIIQRETGGNLAELLDNISALIRSRLKLYGTIRVLSAEGKLSAWILTLLPICVAGLINIINPEFMPILWKDPTGFKVLVGITILMILGIIWMRKIIKIRV